MVCNKCGKNLKDDAFSCSECGAQVNDVAGKKEKDKGLIWKYLCIIFGVILVIGIAIILPISRANIEKDSSEVNATTDTSEVKEVVDEMESVPKYLSQLVSYEKAEYNYSGANILDLSLRNYQPNQKQEGMNWDSALLYTLEDISDSSYEDGQIAKYKTDIHNFINLQTGNAIQCFVYTHPDNGQINKIVTVEKQEGGYFVSDYYYDNGKVDFVFTRTAGVYTPTNATIDIVGNRYYFNNDVMVRYRTIEMPRQIVEKTLAPSVVWYPSTSYFEMNAEEQAEYDAVEYQILNEAYNVYNAVLNQVNIQDIRGYVYNTDGVPLADVSIAVIDSSEKSVLYSSKTLEDGSYHLYVSLDDRDCYLQIYLDGYIPVYIYDVKMDISLLSNIASNIYLPDTRKTQTATKIYLYDSIEVTADENAPSLQNAKVVIRNGLNARSGERVVEGNIGNDGVFETTLTPGAYTAEFSLDGFITTYENFYVKKDICIVKGYTVAAITDNSEKIVLCWDSDIDLDLVLYTPEKSVYGDMGYINIGHSMDDYNNFIVADATASRCEVLNISNLLEGQYNLFVNDFTNYQNGTYDANALAMSGARVYIYSSKGLIAAYYIDAGQSGVVWNVCEKGIDYYPCSIVSSDIDKYNLVDKHKDKEKEALQAYEEFLAGERKAIVVNEIKDTNYERGEFLLNNQYGKDEIINNFRHVYGYYFDNTVSEKISLIDHNNDGIPEMIYYLDDIGYYGWDAYYIRLNKANKLELYGVATGNFREYPSFYKNGMYSMTFVFFWLYGSEYYSLNYESGQNDKLASFMVTEYDEDESADKDVMYYKRVYVPNLNDWDDESVMEDYEKAMNEIIYPLCDQFSKEYCGRYVDLYEIDESSIQNILKRE